MPKFQKSRIGPEDGDSMFSGMLVSSYKFTQGYNPKDKIYIFTPMRKRNPDITFFYHTFFSDTILAPLHLSLS
jgi:hypothetical protein